MTANVNNSHRGGRLTGLLVRHRRLLVGAAIAAALYALLGFFLAPWLVQKQAVETVRAQFDSELRLRDVALNPFVLSLRIDGLELDDPLGSPVARIEQIFLNFQLSSLFHWAWTFEEFRLDAPELFVSRDSGGSLSLARLLAERPESSADEVTRGDEAGMPRLIIQEFAINRSSVHWRDEVPADPVEHDFGPITVAILGLNTLPEQAGQQTVVISTETAATLSWSGSLQLNPLASSGQAVVGGSHFGLLSDYIRHESGFDIVKGDVDVQFDYAVSTDPDGGLSATIDNFGLALTDLQVETFPTPLAPEITEERELMSLPSLRVAGGRFEWPARVVAVDSFDIDGARVRLYRDETGVLELMRALPAADATGAEEQEAATESDRSPAGPTTPWRITLDRFGLENLAVTLEDHSLQPVTQSGVERLDLEVTDISNEPGGRFPTKLSFDGQHGGTVTLAGIMSLLPEPVFDFELDVAGLSVATADPYLNQLADVSMDSGALGAQGRITSDGEDPLRFDGELQITNFLLTETDEGSRIGSWDALVADRLVFTAAGESLEISELRFEKPYADIVITEDGQVNLGRLAKVEGGEESSAAGSQSDEARSEADPGAGNVGPPLAVTVGRVVIVDASADFADRSLPLPFSVKVADLNGELSTIATRSSEPSEVSLEGAVDKFGLVRVGGTVTPLNPVGNTDLKVVFRNVDMPKFSAYSVPFAGRKIDSGRLDLDLGYRVTDGQLVGENNIVLRKFELGEKVPHPDAVSLPLGLAVALLKDPSGNIDVDLPVRGDVGDPEFSIGGVITKALGNLIVKIAASPFALLGKLVGVEASDLEYVNFLAGRADLTPPELETVGKLAEALNLRPELVLEVPGIFAPEADAAALREAHFEMIVEQRIEAMSADEDDQAIYTERRRAVLEQLFLEQYPQADSQSALEAMRARHTRPPGSAAGDGASPEFDPVAYVADLRRELIDMQPLSESELTELATGRAQILKAAIVAVDADLAGRVNLVGPREVAVEGDLVPMKVELTTGAGEREAD